ncbi:MAG: hypothetical protein ACOZAG_01185, partial [Patescibacteria group bacterium]
MATKEKSLSESFLSRQTLNPERRMGVGGEKEPERTDQGDEIMTLIPEGREMTVEEQRQFLGNLFAGLIRENTP